MLKGLIFLFFFAITFFTTSQEKEDIILTDSSAYRPKLVALPILFYTPETRLGFGAASFLSFKTNASDRVLRPSQLAFGGAYTLENQVLLYADFDVWAKTNQWNLNGELGYYRFFYNFWGIGEETRELEVFAVNFPRIRFDGFYEVTKGLYAGPKYTFDHFDMVDRQTDGRLITDYYSGTAGGSISGAGAVVKFDTRNHNFYPTNGYLVTTSLERFGQGIGSDFNYTLSWTNAIRYFDLKNNRVLATNIYGRFAVGDVPFFHLSQMGGGNRMRGYYEGYHRDKQMLGWQAEYRTPVYKRIGMVAFAGNAVVSDEVARFKLSNVKTTAGLGLRVKLDKERNINLRVDIGVSSDRTTGFYLTIGEAF